MNNPIGITFESRNKELIKRKQRNCLVVIGLLILLMGVFS